MSAGSARLRALASTPGAGAAALTAAFLLVTVQWLAVDGRIPDFDAGKHLLIAFEYRGAVGGANDVFAPFTRFYEYPPLVHVIAAMGTVIGGYSVASATLASAFVFVPLLALGVYRAGKVAFDARTGLLATAFALGAPMAIAQFHVLMLDGPQTALVAVTVWLLLASQRFEHPGWSAAAGAALGAGMMAKQTTPVFVAGFIAVVLVRGGWRQWRGLAAFAAGAAVVGLPWYAYHLGDIDAYVKGATQSPQAVVGAEGYMPARWSLPNVAWYLWNLVNLQLLIPLTAGFVAGSVLGLRRWVRDRRADDPVPELIGGVVVSYLVLTFVISTHDVRYSLPALVYLALLGTWWIGRLEGRRFTLAAGALGVVVVANTLAIGFGVGTNIRISLPGATHEGRLHQRELTLLTTENYPVGAPEAGGDSVDLLRAVRRDGVRILEYDAVESPVYNATGIDALGRIAGLRRPPRYFPNRLKSDQAFLTRIPLRRSLHPPCVVLVDGSGLYLNLGPAVKPPEHYDYCPLRESRLSRPHGRRPLRPLEVPQP